MKNNIIIVAGGKGLRVGGELPKQFIAIGGKPILMHTITAFHAYDADMKIILVLPESHQEYWAELCKEYNFTIPHQITTGGETRFHSVKNGLALIDTGCVGVHDGARPFVDSHLIDRCYKAVQKHKAVVPVVDATDSLREIISETESRIIDRSKIKLVQTPQVFTVEILKKAYEATYTELFTDDASVVEALGINVHLVKGDVQNIKVTTPIDLKIGELLLTSKQGK